MINFFEYDRQKELKEYETKIKEYFHARLCSSQMRDEKLQRKINQWSSLKHYQYLRSDESIAAQMRHIIKKWFEMYAKNLDTTIDTLFKVFPKQCSQTVFELVMADFVSRKYDLVEKSTSPDLLFDKYFLECTTSISSVIDQFDALLFLFDDVFYVLEIMFEKSEKSNTWFFQAFIVHECRTLPAREIEIIQTRLLRVFPDRNGNIAASVCDLIDILRYACMYFKELIPDEVIKKLNRLSFPLQSISNQSHDYDFLTKRLAMSVCDKLKSEYFSNGKPGVVAVSLAMATPGLSLNAHQTKEFIEHLNRNFIYALCETVSSYKTDDRDKVINGLNNLYAVIVDTCWYNWFPDILGVGWDTCKNIYCAIYNEDFVGVERNEKIFDTLVCFELELPLGRCIEEMIIE